MITHPSAKNLMRRLVVFSTFLLGLGTATGGAQSNATGISPRDSLYRRARKLVSEGNGAAGRVLVDSLLRQSVEDTPAYGDALYWRGALAETAADAERDYRRVIVEYPVSPYADDALLALVELEQARGDRAGALQHLQRFVREHQVGNPARGVAALAAARLAFDQRDTRTGCSMITEARASAATTDVEMRNQIDYFGGRCTADVAASVPTSTAPVPVARDSNISGPKKRTVLVKSGSKVPKKSLPKAGMKTPDTVSEKTSDAVPARADEQGVMKPTKETPAAEAANRPAKGSGEPAGRSTVTGAAKGAATPPIPREPVDQAPPPVKVRGGFTIQLAAYNTLPDAERLVARLKSQGVPARVSGLSKPFRVRLDFYATRQEAQDEVAALKKRGIIGFVTTEQSPVDAKTP